MTDTDKPWILASDDAANPANPNEPDIIIGSQEHILYLLAEAAEIEHTLMCSYLYAAFSLKDKSQKDFSGPEAEAVERWRKMIMGVAVEEMGHLLLVANLTVALGGQPHFHRPNFPVSEGYFPSGVIAKLTKFSFETLDHFIFLERPAGVKGKDGKGYIHSGQHREQPLSNLMPNAQDYGSVSHLYEAIRANLIEFSQRAGEKNLFIGSIKNQVGSDLFKMEGIQLITDLNTASQAIDIIIEQGEGSPTDREHSHYNRFREIRSEYKTILAKNPNFAPAWPVAENPVMQKGVSDENKVFIDAQPAAMVLDFSNAVYNMLLRLLVQLYTQRSTDAVISQARLLSAAIELMHVLGTSSRILATLAACDDIPEVNAGISFTTLRGVEPFSINAEKFLIIERLAQLSAGAGRLSKKLPEFGAISEKLQRLANGIN